MSKLQSIEEALKSVNQAVFQELCDSFLALRNPNYAAFARTGSQSGKQKTVKGTPDTFLLLPNGKFIFVEYSTNITAGVSKLKDDISKCIDTKKTSIPVNQISEIILCVNFKLAAKDINSLKDLLTNTRILLTIYTLDALSLELSLNHRNLAHQYLGLTLDTGQIVSIDQFVKDYNNASKGVSTPLDNTFIPRDAELNEIEKAIEQYNFIILTGAPGVGKTRLALEGIDKFLKANLLFSAYCVSYKNYNLLEDLFQYFDSEKNYVLFVDDANRIDAFSQIVGFYKSPRKGRLKVIITVRDYAFQEIGMLSQEFSPHRIDLAKVTDEQIVEIIKAHPFGITAQSYQNEIIRIADGNPRIAIMTALLANAEQDLRKLADVSELFDKYFSTFILDKGDFAKDINLKCLGIIAFFYTIPYKNKELTESILNNFGIQYSDFIECIDNLDKLEIVEIQYEHVKIPEQNLGIYFFYRCFIKDKLLSFETLLDKYFESNFNRFRDCIIPANNTFGPQKVMDVLQPDLKKNWALIKEDEDKAFRFLSTFWFYLQLETLEFIYNKTESFPNVEVEKYDVTYETNSFAFRKNDIIELVSKFYFSPNHLKDAIELSFEYVRKKPEQLPELIHKIRESLTFDSDDARYGFYRQSILFDVILPKLNDNLYGSIFYALAKTFLSFHYHHTKGGRKMEFIFYDYPIPFTAEIKQFRTKVWKAIDTHFEANKEDSLSVLESYSQMTRGIIAEIMQFDLEFLVTIIDKHLNPNSFEDCEYVQSQIRWCKRNNIHNEAFSQLAEKFTNPLYETYLKIDWNRFRDKDFFDFDDYEDYQKLKEKELREAFIFKSTNEIVQFYSDFIYLKSRSKNAWNYTFNSLEFIIDENLNVNFERGCEILLTVIKHNNEIDYVPRIVFYNHLKTDKSTQIIWQMIANHDFHLKALWQLAFFDFIDESLINKGYVNELIKAVGEMTEPNTVNFERLKRFLTIEPKLFEFLMRSIVEKNERENTKVHVWVDFFSTHFNELGEDFELIKKCYLQQSKIADHFDYTGEGFLNILRTDPNFLLEYVNSLDSKEFYGVSSQGRSLSFIWKIDNIEPVLTKVFDLVIERETYLGILDHFCNDFFSNINGAEEKVKAKEFLINYIKKHYEDSNKVNVVVDILRNSLKEFFEEILLLFLTLTQDVTLFSEILWRGSGTFGSGGVILADIEMADWINIRSIIEKSGLGMRLFPIRKYVEDQIESCKISGNWERQRRFLERH